MIREDEENIYTFWFFLSAALALLTKKLLPLRNYLREKNLVQSQQRIWVHPLHVRNRCGRDDMNLRALLHRHDRVLMHVIAVSTKQGLHTQAHASGVPRARVRARACVGESLRHDTPDSAFRHLCQPLRLLFRLLLLELPPRNRL